MTTIAEELAALQRMTATSLRARYVEVFGEQPSSANKTWLLRRVAWRVQSLAEGGLSERARRRAEELANDADLRTTPPRTKAAEPTPELTAVKAVQQQDGRLPPPGSVLTRLYKGATLQVRILTDGFEYAGKVYGSLSAVAKEVTGSHCNGFLFFRLTRNGGDR